MASHMYKTKISLGTSMARISDRTSDHHAAPQNQEPNINGLQAAQDQPNGLPLLCSHNDGLAPRPGTTTVHGTPTTSPMASGWNSEASSIFHVRTMPQPRKQ